MHYLITGHTGFKGSWLALLLAHLGHSISGVALDPEPDGLFAKASVRDSLEHDIRGDIRDPETVARALDQARPDVLIHLAAQPLVRESYRLPRYTIETNVMGTLNVLEAASRAPSVRAQLIVTTDKVYRNENRVAGYVENEPLGGNDPYSASKAMSDLLAHAWVTSFPSPPTAVARAGNVIGGGDYGKDRLIPDLVAGLSRGKAVRLRYPESVRPWQHVLDCLNGYLAITDNLLAHDEMTGLDETWNIGPGIDSFRTVAEMSALVRDLWGGGGLLELSPIEEPHEAGLLALDSSKARKHLNWANRLEFPHAVAWTVDWYKRVAGGEDPASVTKGQIAAFCDLSAGPSGNGIARDLSHSSADDIDRVVHEAGA